jgi:uracil permease
MARTEQDGFDRKEERMTQRIIGVDEKVPIARALPLGLQHMMAMFGATVLVPILTGMDPSLAIMCSGIGTILYLLVTRGKIPSYLGSSFAFIAPVATVVASRGIEHAMGAIVITGLVFLVVAGIIRLAGTGWINRILPPVLVGAVIMVIGIGLSATAVGMAFNNGGDAVDYRGLTAATATLLAAIAFSSYFKGFISTIPVLLGVIVGYLVAALMGLVDFRPVIDAAWVGLPTLRAPIFDPAAIVLVAPIAFVVVIEHIGHLLVVGEIVGKDYSKMMPQSLAGDGLGTLAAGFFGGPPQTTYAENMGVMSVTKVYATQVFWYAAGFAFVIGGFVPKLGALIQSIPTCVMGGVSLLLFGLIAANGLRMLVANKVDFSKNRNLMIVSAVLIVGIGMECSGLKIVLGDYEIPGMAASAVLGIVFNLILPRDRDERKLI